MERLFLGSLFIATVALSAIFATSLRPLLFASAQTTAKTTPELAQFKEVQGAPSINQIYALVNKQRVSAGIAPLTRNEQLTKVAEQRATDMASRSYYAHKDPSGKYFYDYMQEQGIDLQYACENLDLQFSMSEQHYIDDWLNSTKGHKECLLNSGTTEAGYAIVKLSTSTYTNSEMPAYIVVAIHLEPKS